MKVRIVITADTVGDAVPEDVKDAETWSELGGMISGWDVEEVTET